MRTTIEKRAAKAGVNLEVIRRWSFKHWWENKDKPIPTLAERMKQYEEIIKSFNA